MRTLTILMTVAVLAFSGCAGEGNDEAVQRALAYLHAEQNPDGGFPASPGESSDFSTSAWVALAFGAANDEGEHVGKLRVHLASQADEVASNATGAFSAVATACMLVLAANALGEADLDYANTDPVGRLRADAGNTSLGLNEKIFIVGTLGSTWRGAELTALIDEITAGLDDQDHEFLAKDGWFRSNAILALLRAGVDDDSTQMRHWAQSLLAFQVQDAGFTGSLEYPPDASTTANVVAVLSDVHFVYSHERETGAEFLKALQQPDGSVKFSHETDFARIKTTAEAILGWTGKGPFQTD